MNIFKKAIISTFALVLMTSVAMAWGPTNYPNGFPTGVTIQNMPILNTYGGNIYWVDSGAGSNSNKGTFSQPFGTIEYAQSRCTASNGDVVMVKPGHVETVIAAGGLDLDIAGVTIVFLGDGTNHAYVTFTTDVGADMDVDAANITLINPMFVAGIDALTGPIDVNSTDFTIINGEWHDATDIETTDCIVATSGATRLRIDGWKVFKANENGTQKESAIQIDGVDDMILQNIVVDGDYDVGIVETGTDEWLRATLQNLFLKNTDPGNGPCLEMDSACSGWADNVHCRNANGVGVSDVADLNWSATCLQYGTDGYTGSLIGTASGGGAAYADCVAAIEADDLDHLFDLDGAAQVYPENASNDSTIAKMLCKGDPATVNTYNCTTDSQEALSDKLGGWSMDGGTDQNDSVKASLDLAHTDLDNILEMGGNTYVSIVDSSGDTTHFVDAAMIGFGDGYFVTGWKALVIYDVGGVNAAPEGEMVDITGYTSTTGTFTIGATTQLATGDVILIARDEVLAIGSDDNNNAFASTNVASNRDGSIIERLEFLCKYFETGTAGALVAPANTRSLLDILGSDGTTTTGALAGSILGAIGTNEAAADTPFTSSAVEADADGAVLERLEFLQQLSDDLLASLRMTGTSIGDVYYVDDATGSDADSGITWALAEATLDAAIGDCTADKGDVIIIAPDHEESIGAAQIAADVNGIKIIGLGSYEQQPMITMTDAASSIDVTGTDVLIENIYLYSTTADSTIAIDDDASGLIVRKCRFGGSGAGHVIGIDIATTLSDITIEDNEVYDLDADCTSFIAASAGAVTNLIVKGNRIWGDFDNAGIYSDQANVNWLIDGNTIRNIQTGDHAIELTSTTTGYIINNLLAADTPGAILDPGSCVVAKNEILDSDVLDAQDIAALDDGEWFYAIHTETFDGSATYNVFTVTGDVEVQVWGDVTTDWTNHADTASLGTSDTAALLIAATAANTIDVNDVWTSATVADAAAAPNTFIIGNGSDIILTGTANIVGGVTAFHCYWRPLSAGASVIDAP